MIRQETLDGNWNQVKGAIQKKYGQLTDDDLGRARGDVNKLIGMIQTKTGQAKDDIEKFLNSTVESGANTMNRVAETASQYASDASESIREGYDYVSAGVQTGYDNLEQTVKQRPLETMAIAFGVGIATGLLVGLSLTSGHRR